MFVSALPDPTCNSEKSANGGNKQILLLLLLLLLLEPFQFVAEHLYFELNSHWSVILSCLYLAFE